MKNNSKSKYYEKYVDHIYIFLAYSLLFNFIGFVVNFVLSVFIVNPKYFLGEERFIPLEIIIIFSVVLAEFCYRRYLKKIDGNYESAGTDGKSG